MQPIMEQSKSKASILSRYKSAILRRFYYRNPLNIYLGQKLYGNDSGYLANLVGRWALKKDRFLSNKISDAGLNKQRIEHLTKKGWLRLEDIQFGDLLDKIRRNLDRYCENKQIPDSQRLEISTIGGSDYFFSWFPEVKEVLTASLREFIEQYYQTYFTVLNVHLYRIFPVPAHLYQNDRYRPYGATSCWHNDGSTVESIKLFVLIDEVDESQGPMHVIGADQTKNIIGEKYYRYTIHGMPGSDLERKSQVIKFTGQAGTVLFANPNLCLHRASEPKSGKKRDMLVFYLTSSSEPLPSDWEKKAIYQQSMGLGRLFNFYSKKQ